MLLGYMPSLNTAVDFNDSLNCFIARIIISMSKFLLNPLLLLCVVSFASVRASESSSFIVQDVRVFDGERFLEERSVLVIDGAISRVSDKRIKRRNTEIVDGEGMTLIPGLIDSHVHLGEPIEEQLSQYLTYGVTTVVDMFSETDVLVRLRELRDQDSDAYPSIHLSGTGAAATRGTPNADDRCKNSNDRWTGASGRVRERQIERRISIY